MKDDHTRSDGGVKPRKTTLAEDLETPWWEPAAPPEPPPPYFDPFQMPDHDIEESDMEDNGRPYLTKKQLAKRKKDRAAKKRSRKRNR